MTEFCIQIHPDRVRDLDLAAVRSVCAALALDRGLVRRHVVVEGEDAGRYVNLMFETERPQEFWSLLQQRLFQSRAIGAPLRDCSMAVCQGEQGWNDYLLLHHYDPAVPQCNHPPGE